mmetsp:Transcript_9491/g.15769  ORF Transcript_9491/g.15769 Transcript_9491/m.15769 type:complete len:226 (+) Transcript_9491:221-898(+)|eukprot:CAMPEP_0119015692 /NCGR_PEP_ID=MMETSP1176-20130426/11425_1 /TAXON_ID=265551 /ORGANISM="Synedropsis recta cf, Strain CCMP1620" /LENGTH=225 /DNA_ID=CAMNT_0006969005 /DNA_START=157 /DNA_END=834 /DNA_ORIENTATION=+
MGTVFGRESVDEPAFSVLVDRVSVGTPYELRQYGPRMAVETSSADGDDNKPFMTLAKYIGVIGKPMNEGAESISMTAPVVMENRGTEIAMTAPVVRSGGETMQFMLPAKYDSIDKVPKPTNPNVHVKELPATVGVAHRYNGSFAPDRSTKMALGLAKQLKEDGLDDLTEDDVLANYQFWGFNPPFTLPMFRRNEVWIPLTQAQADKLVNSFASGDSADGAAAEHN